MISTTPGPTPYEWAALRLIGRAEAAATAGIELAESLLPRCLPVPVGDLEISDFLTAPPDPETRRMLTVAAPFVREGTRYAIPNRLIVFVPAVLPGHATRFRVAVAGSDYFSGTYRGRVRLTSLPDARVHEMDAVVDL